MPGKKAKDPKDQKKKILQIRLSAEDRQAIKDLAKARGLSVSDMIRSTLLGDKSG